jgi:hypothetical protein
MEVVFSERTNREEANDWSSGATTRSRQITLMCARQALRCFVIFDEEQGLLPYRNLILSTASWAWYGNVAIIPVEGDWPPNFRPRISYIRSVLRMFSYRP